MSKKTILEHGIRKDGATVLWKHILYRGRDSKLIYGFVEANGRDYVRYVDPETGRVHVSQVTPDDLVLPPPVCIKEVPVYQYTEQTEHGPTVPRPQLSLYGYGAAYQCRGALKLFDDGHIEWEGN